jgi:hypothetical protein
VVDITVTVVTDASAAASIAIVDNVLGLSALQSVPDADELGAADIAELLLPSGIEADAEAEAEALTSGVLTEALTLGVLTLAETLAETLALTDALVS